MPRLREVAVFPVPKMVAFPRQRIPLHITEPRYRQMVMDCVEDSRLLALALPQKSSANLSRRQNTSTMSETASIFGAGPVKIIEVMGDGRMLIETRIAFRFQLREWSQQLPYLIGMAKPLDDKWRRDPVSDTLFDLLMGLSQTVLGSKFRMFQDLVPENVQTEKNLSILTFEIFKWCRLEPETMQLALEMTEPRHRARLLTDALSRYVEMLGPEQDETLPRGLPSNSDESREDGDEWNSPSSKIIHADFVNKSRHPTWLK